MNVNEEALANALEGLLDPEVGVIQTVSEDTSLKLNTHFYHYYARVSHTRAFCQQHNFATTRGAGVTRERALAKAIGEGIERYCAAIYDKDLLPFCAYEEASFPAIDPQAFLQYSPALYQEKDFLMAPFTRRDKVRWTNAINLTDHSTLCFVPAAYTYLPYLYEKNEKRMTQPISTGLACHVSYERAAVTAICEVVERDAFMLHWRARLSPPIIPIHSLPTDLQTLTHFYAAKNQALFLLDITTDIKLPTVLAALRSTLPHHPSFIIAGACKLSPHAAILSALEELEQTRHYALSLYQRQRDTSFIPDYTTIKTQDDHLLFWAYPEHLHLADFLFESKVERRFEEMSDLSLTGHLPFLTQLFTQLGLTVLLADLTTEDVADQGLRVVRAILPQLHPLAFGFRNSEFVCQRLETLQAELNSTRARGFTLSTLPHPFP